MDSINNYRIYSISVQYNVTAVLAGSTIVQVGFAATEDAVSFVMYIHVCGMPLFLFLRFIDSLSLPFLLYLLRPFSVFLLFLFAYIYT